MRLPPLHSLYWKYQLILAKYEFMAKSSLLQPKQSGHNNRRKCGVNTNQKRREKSRKKKDKNIGDMKTLKKFSSHPTDIYTENTELRTKQKPIKQNATLENVAAKYVGSEEKLHYGINHGVM